jgi:predicted DNA-binding WGR domain protein
LAKSSTYADVVAACLEKIRPQIEAQITQSNVFYDTYLFASGKIKLSGGALKVPITQTATTQTWYEKEPEVRKFHFIGGKSSKFWQIYEPMDVGGGHQFAVKVEYGRIGSSGQNHTKVFWNQTAALKYYEKIIAKKLDKGYVEQQKSAKKKQAVPAGCSHDSLQRVGLQFKCNGCGDTVEWQQSLTEISPVEAEKKAKRFINLNWR